MAMVAVSFVVTFKCSPEHDVVRALIKKSPGFGRNIRIYTCDSILDPLKMQVARIDGRAAIPPSGRVLWLNRFFQDGIKLRNI
jgi:hypothetical protein